MHPSAKIHYGWIVVGITCLVLLTGAGIRSTPGILMVPLEEEFHWSGDYRPRRLDQPHPLRLHRSVRRRRHGALWNSPLGVVRTDLVGVGVASTSLMRQPWQLILMWGFLVGSGTGFLATVLSATIATRWFTARRGLVIGILSGGASTGSFCFCP